MSGEDDNGGGGGGGGDDPFESAQGLGERYQRGATAHAIHVWWARRPFSSMRQLVQTAIAGADDGRDRDAPPRVLDPFAGGATIPLAAAQLGCEAHSSDLNELSVFVQRALLGVARAWRGDAAAWQDALRAYGTRVLDALAAATAPLFPQRGAGADGLRPTQYLWTYRTTCAACGYQPLLTRRQTLARRRGRPTLRLALEDAGASARFATTTDADAGDALSVWGAGRRKARCPKCSAALSTAVDGAQEVLAAVVLAAANNGKRYHVPAEAEAALWAPPTALARPDDARVPRSEFPQLSGVVNPPLHGIRSHADLFNGRQARVCLALADALGASHCEACGALGRERADALFRVLAALIDQLVDWNSRLTMWIPQNEQVGRAFCGPGIAMLWDYVETDPVAGGPAGLHGKLDRIIRASTELAELPGGRAGAVGAGARRADATALPWPDEFFDAVVTDPPYYDNILYTPLADAFYAWKRPFLRTIDPDLFAADSTTGSGELVCSRLQQGAGAHAHYVARLGTALAEMERVLRPGGSVALVFSHSSLAPWEALRDAFRATGLRVEAVHPLNVERPQRPRAMNAAAVNTCMVFVARKGDGARPLAAVDAARSELLALAEDRGGAALRARGWHDADIGLTLFARGIGHLCNLRPPATVVPTDNADPGDPERELLREFAAAISERYPGFRLRERRSL